MRHKLARFLWRITYIIAFRPSPGPFHVWRRMLLRIFGATVAAGTAIHPSVVIWAPWNLTMQPLACLAPNVDCYNVARIIIAERATVSQYSYLCSASHDYTDLDLPLTSSPITVGAYAWVCAGAFVGPGVAIGEGAIVGARSSVFKDVAPWTIVGGTPARFLKLREIVKGQ